MRTRVAWALVSSAILSGLVAWAVWGENSLAAAVGLVAGAVTVGTGVALLARVRRRAWAMYRATTRRLDSVTGGLDRTLAAVASTSNAIEETAERLDSVSERLDSVSERLDSVSERLDSLSVVVESLSDSTSSLARDIATMSGAVDELRSMQDRESVRASRAEQDQFHQIEALIGLYREIDTAVPLIGTRGWAACPDLLHYLYSVIIAQHPQLVVECGSGLSTVVMGYAVRAANEGRVVALEHDPKYAEMTSALLAKHELVDWAEVRLAPLEIVEVMGELRPWYRLESVPKDPIGLLFVDGPPADTAELARLPALPLMEERLEPEAVVVLDDYHRPEERRIVELWLESVEWSVEVLDHEKGTAVLRRRTA